MIRVTWVLGLMVLVGVARAQAPGPVDQRAQAAQLHYETGMAHFQLEEWDKAIDEWEAGFRAKPVPQFLYNIAQAYRLSKRPDKALAFYQKYLRMDPKAANRVEVERHINQLTRLVEQQSKAATSPPVETKPVEAARPTAPPPTATTAPPPATTPAPPPPASATTTPTTTTAPPAAATAAPAPAATRGDVVATAPRKDDRVTRKPWFWGVMAGVGAVVIAGVVVGVVLGTSDSTKTLPTVRF
jgi:tetratricopeptide repeat protein